MVSRSKICRHIAHDDAPSFIDFLEGHGLIEYVPYLRKGRHYRLTRKGSDIYDLLRELESIIWGE